ncbi:penicillin-binding protein 2 [Pedobacter sp. SYP-B3415]|uniref:penicillin-binding protein 2 n=1 Tax=Pedobacter sp. SYP-B3415 TaxID=2496641 RepID=UPI00101B6A69|nr:penicillin-binding protein 2 [Pedobacter sp. SYP-B3415]
MNNLFNRKYIVQGVFIVVLLILVAKLFYIQIASDKYFISANSNVLRNIFTYPARGAILDRNGHVLVQNEPVYDLMVTPNEVKPFDTLDLCRTIGIDKKRFYKSWRKAMAQSRYRESVFEKQLSVQVYARLQEKLGRYRGFRVQKRTVRQYPDSVGGQLFGYVKEVSEKDIEKSSGYYRMGDYIGKSGLEMSYEEVLRGQRGITRMIYDARNVAQGSYANGEFDTLAVSGAQLISGIDIKLQKLGEKLMQNKVGAIVALEPGTGEILAFVSSPSYDPNLTVGRDWGNNYMKLFANPYRIFNSRPIQGMYSPGSAFKPIDALIGMQEGVIDPNTTFFCPGFYQAGNHKVRCEHVDGNTNLRRGLARSCNTYACYIFQKLLTRKGMKNQRAMYGDWEEKIRKFGFGHKLEIDLPWEKNGIFYTEEEYNKRWGKRWGYTTVISLAIGQGEITSTPLQMANAMAIIANRGYYYKPHIIKGVGDGQPIDEKYRTKNFAGVDARYYEPVIDGMQDAVNAGYGTAYASRVPNVLLCGKTGTVQNPHGKNHAVFIGFAPRDNPKIAIAVVVENAGYGGSYAAPVASYMVEQYLTDSISPGRKAQAQWMMEQNLLPVLKSRTKPARHDTLKKKIDTAGKKPDTVPQKRSIQPKIVAVKP